MRFTRIVAVLAATCLCGALAAQQAAINAPQVWTWQQLRDKFEAANPSLKAGKLNIDEARAQEITAFLRPNPDLTLLADGTQVAPSSGIWRPFQGTDFYTSVSYLHERRHKRELRLETAKKSTEVASSTYLDQERNLVFNLRAAFVQALQAKAILENARENLAYWDRELEISRTRLGAGDIAQMDLNRLELQRVQFESDLEVATVNVRTAKIQLQTLLNDRTPIEQFDVSGSYDFSDSLMPLDQFRTLALDTRPDLKAAAQNVELATAQHRLAIANGSSDPTWSVWYTKNPSFNNPYDNQSLGVSVSLPLRIFDRNQGEKERTALDVQRNRRLQEAAMSQVYGDVDSSYSTLQSAVNLLRPYRDKYLKLAADVRDRVSFAYRNGGTSLLDYMDAEKSYRDTRLAYLNLVGSYLTAASQMNLAVGREIIQ